MAANGFGEHSPGGYSLMGGARSPRSSSPVCFLIWSSSAPPTTARQRASPAWPSGSALTLDPPDLDPDRQHLGQPWPDPPASRSSTATVHRLQLWVFWLAPLIGAAIAGVAYPYLFGRQEELADRPVRDDALEDRLEDSEST